MSKSYGIARIADTILNKSLGLTSALQVDIEYCESMNEYRFTIKGFAGVHTSLNQNDIDDDHKFCLAVEKLAQLFRNNIRKSGAMK